MICCCNAGTQFSRVVVTHERYNQANPLNVASTFATSTGSGVGWASMSNCQVSDNVYTVDLWDSGSFANGNTLDLSNFKFDIPSDATINGITVTVERKGSAITVLKDKTVQLIIAGTPSGSNKASATTYTTSDVTATYGSSSDLWGLTLAPSDVNDSTFGIRFQAQTTSVSGNVSVSVDRITITVSYTNPASATMTALDGGDLSFVWRYDHGFTGFSTFAWIPAQPIIDADGNIYVKTEGRTALGVNQTQVTKHQPDGTLIWTWNSGNHGIGTSSPQIGRNTRICFDNSGNILVGHKLLTTGNYFLTVLDTSGAVVTQFAYPGGGITAGLDFTTTGPNGLGVDSGGNIYVGLFISGKLLKLDSSGNQLAIATVANSTIQVNSTLDIIYLIRTSQTSPTSTVTLRQYDCATLTENWNKTYAQINASAGGASFQSNFDEQIDSEVMGGEAYFGCNCFNSSGTTLNNFAKVDSSGAVQFTALYSSLPVSGVSFFNVFCVALDQDTAEAYLIASQNDLYQRVYKTNLSGTFDRSGFAPGITAGIATPNVMGAAARTFTV